MRLQFLPCPVPTGEVDAQATLCALRQGALGVRGREGLRQGWLGVQGPVRPQGPTGHRDLLSPGGLLTAVSSARPPGGPNEPASLAPQPTHQGRLLAPCPPWLATGPRRPGGGMAHPWPVAEGLWHNTEQREQQCLLPFKMILGNGAF